MTPSSTFLNVFKIHRDSWEIVPKDFAISEHFFMQIIQIEIKVSK